MAHTQQAMIIMQKSMHSIRRKEERIGETPREETRP